MKRAPVTDDLIGADKKISNCLIKITFLVRVETAVRYLVEVSWPLA